MRMTRCIQSAFVSAEGIQLRTVKTRAAWFAASARAALGS
jgi:hypothetical protein